MTADPWPRPIPRGPAVGDTVELGRSRYQVTALHTVDEGTLLAVRDGRGPARFVLATELRWTVDCWAPGSEAEDRVMDANR